MLKHYFLVLFGVLEYKRSIANLTSPLLVFNYVTIMNIIYKDILIIYTT